MEHSLFSLNYRLYPLFVIPRVEARLKIFTEFSDRGIQAALTLSLLKVAVQKGRFPCVPTAVLKEMLPLQETREVLALCEFHLPFPINRKV